MLKKSALKEVDRVEIISVVDNNVDVISQIQREEVQKFREWIDKEKHFSMPFAEHGFSLLIRIFYNDDCHTILFDTGLSSSGAITNAKRMGIKLKDIELIVLSHGHYDHFGGLVNVTKKIGKEDLPIMVHENALRIRGKRNQEGSFMEYPRFPEDAKVIGKVLKRKQYSLLFDDYLLVTGEIDRKTDFEKGLTNNYVFSNGNWISDPWIWDDQAIVLNVINKGLLVVSGCAHAGIVNTILFAQQITRIKKIHSIIGGFHLSRKESGNRIKKTGEIIKKMHPDLISPMHCTSWQAKCTFSKIMPQAFVWNSVGNLYKL